METRASGVEAYPAGLLYAVFRPRRLNTPLSRGAIGSMRVLFVTPSDTGSGEAVTAAHLAERLARRGVHVAALTSPSTEAFFSGGGADTTVALTGDRAQNRLLWDRTLERLRPQAIVFADFPLMYFSSGVPPLADDEWLEGLADSEAVVATLDHLGYAQRAQQVFFGPSHCSLHCETLPQTPAWIPLLLPCPMQPPGPIAGRRGIPVRYWDLPLSLPPETREEVRRTYLDNPDDVLVFHAVPGWAWRIADRYALPLHRFLARILRYCFAGVSRPVTVVSVNNGSLLEPIDETGFRVRNLRSLPRERFESLMLSADLMISENGISSALGKALCGGVTAVALRNSFGLMRIVEQADAGLKALILEMERCRVGAVFPFEVYPIWTRADLAGIGPWWEEDSACGVERLELFGGDATRERLRALLDDPHEMGEARRRRQTFVGQAAALPAAEDVLEDLVTGDSRVWQSTRGARQ